MPTALVWRSSRDARFPSQLAQYLGAEAPSRIASIGNPEILNSKPLALICSVKCPGNIILQTYDLAKKLREAGVPVIGGFHSPMEQECLRILLRGMQPVIVCPARGLQGMRIPSEHKPAFEEGRLLYLSPFSDTVRRATVDTALRRNRFVAALAEHIVVPYAAPDSKTFELCRVLTSWKKPVSTLASEANGALLKLGARSVEGSVDEFALKF
ncbi:MAG: DNA-processing protein DprA [Nitrospira sp.]|nr:DNA-processing protein DprA [Nitrospira sp.]